MASSHDSVRYASAEDVLLALDKDPEDVSETLEKRARRRAEAATERWINRTSRPFHPVRVGNPDEPRSWPVFDVQDAETFEPVRVMLDHRRILPLDPDEDDALEVRTRRDTWRDITDDEGRSWTMENRTRRLNIYRRRVKLVPFDDPNTRFLRLTYRYGPLGEGSVISEDGVVESVPADVRDAVAAYAAMRLVLDDNSLRSVPDDGQLSDRGSKRSAFKEEWEDTVSEYGGFSTV